MSDGFGRGSKAARYIQLAVRCSSLSRCSTHLAFSAGSPIDTGYEEGGHQVTTAVPTRELGYVNPAAGWWMPPSEETTPELRWPRSVEVYDQMRRQDAQVTSVLRAVTLPVRRTAWRIDPGEARPEVVELVATDLGLPVTGQPAAPPRRTRDRFSWATHLQTALLMIVYGHSYFEQVYRLESGLARLRKLALRPAKTISAINVATDGGLESIEQYAPAGGFAAMAKIPVNRLVAYVHDREGGNWLGTSLLRPAYKHWLIKDRLLRVQAQTIDRNGMGVPLYRGAENEQDLTKGTELAKAWRSGENSGAAVPHGADLLLRGVEGDLPDAEPAIRYHDEQIARAVLAHFLNLGTQTGSWALGSTFADFFTFSLQTLAEQVADTANAHIVEDLVDVNFGEDEPAPRIVFDEIGSKHGATAQAIKMLIDAGAIFPDRQLEEFIRTAFGLPLKDSPSPAPTSSSEDS